MTYSFQTLPSQMDQAIWLSRALHQSEEDQRRQELIRMLIDPATAAAAAASLMMPNLRSANIENREPDSNPGQKSNNYFLNGNSQQSSSSSSLSNPSLAKRRKLSRHSENSGINGSTSSPIGGKVMCSQPLGLGSNPLSNSATRPPPLTLGDYY